MYCSVRNGATGWPRTAPTMAEGENGPGGRFGGSSFASSGAFILTGCGWKPKLQHMIIDDIKERLANGFKPFAIQLSDGRRFVIPQRDFIAFTPKKIALFDEKGVSHVINTLHVVSIDDSVEQGA